MHFEILVEDKSGEEALKELVPKIIGQGDHTFTVHSYKGIGHIPKKIDLHRAKTATLLNNLPQLITGYARTWGTHYSAVLFIICDLDDRDLGTFKEELEAILQGCPVQPKTRFCIAIEEGEAWLMGDIAAIKKAYPNAKDGVLQSYQNDSICGTWEKLADAIYTGGSIKLKKKCIDEIGKEKSEWAKNICKYMDVDHNSSPSFCYFRDKLRALI